LEGVAVERSKRLKERLFSKSLRQDASVSGQAVRSFRADE